MLQRLEGEYEHGAQLVLVSKGKSPVDHLAAEIPQLLAQLHIPRESARIELVAVCVVPPADSFQARVQGNVARCGCSLVFRNGQFEFWFGSIHGDIRKQIYFNCTGEVDSVT